MPVSEIEDKYLSEGWEQGTENLVEIESLSEEKGWNAIHTWGFEVCEDGVRRYVRHVRLMAKKPAKTVECKMVYDYYP